MTMDLAAAFGVSTACDPSFYLTTTTAYIVARLARILHSQRHVPAFLNVRRG